MSLVLQFSNKVTIKVAGTINDAAGLPKPFDFKLECKRLTSDEFEARRDANPNEKLTDFLLDVVEGWQGIKDPEGKPIPYSEEAFRQLCGLGGMDSIMFVAYRVESGAKAKN